MANEGVASIDDFVLVKCAKSVVATVGRKEAKVGNAEELEKC